MKTLLWMLLCAICFGNCSCAVMAQRARASRELAIKQAAADSIADYNQYRQYPDTLVVSYSDRRGSVQVWRMTLDHYLSWKPDTKRGTYRVRDAARTYLEVPMSSFVSTELRAYNPAHN